MCGIYGYLGKRNGIKIAIDGLKRLEYRGYDSAGIGLVDARGLTCFKEVGKIHALEKVVGAEEAGLVIAHTRWATHGKLTRENAHPQLDSKGEIAVIHNGIIENYQALRNSLEQSGIKFVSETDTEVLPNLIARCYKGDLLKAVQEALAMVQGAYAIAVIRRSHPDEMIVAANGSPLVIGLGKEEAFVSSDPNTLLHHTRDVMYLSGGEIGHVSHKGISVFDPKMTKIAKKAEQLTHTVEESSKGKYEHFTLKEIFEQPKTIQSAMQARFIEEYGTAVFDELQVSVEELLAVKQILIIGCGTSWNAGLLASYLFEDMARLPTSVHIASEFRYKNPIVLDGSLVIAISQSGETADTIAAMRELKAKGAFILGICNVQGSTLAREADSCIFLRAGPEVGVCSTKAFTSQLVVLSLLTLLLGRMRHMSKADGQKFLKELQTLPGKVEIILEQAPHIERIAKKYAAYEHFFFLGRRYMYPTSLEGALKLKEIAYVDANGYPAGEMKHGPLALINENCPTIALCADHGIYEKLLSNLMEVKARLGKVVAIASSKVGLEKIADEFIQLPGTHDEFAPILATVACQLFAYYVAKIRGTEIDKPRNLAKSVTVE